jgi:hypothetical protein
MNTTHWLIALTVGLVGFIIYVLVCLAKIKEAILNLAEGGLSLVAAVEILAAEQKPSSGFTNTNTVAQSKKIIQETLNKLK